MRTIKNFDVKNKRVLVRVDFNVPFQINENDNSCIILDDRRIKAALPTIEYLVKKKAAVLLMTHIGRPDGSNDSELTRALDVVVLRLQEMLGKLVQCVAEGEEKEIAGVAAKLKAGEIMILPNVRLDPREAKNDMALAKEWAALADIYVNDAFSVSHRAHASVEAITHFLPSCAGLLFMKEYSALNSLQKDVKKPFILILGGAKAEDKIPVIEHLLPRLDFILVGGVVANSFLKASQIAVGNSLVSDIALKSAEHTLNLIKQSSVKLILPIDVSFDQDGMQNQMDSKNVEDLPSSAVIKDIGDQTVDKYITLIKSAKTIFWNGTLGIAEDERFEQGTKRIAGALTKVRADITVSGGDTLSAIDKFKLSHKFKNLSLGGGASLEFLAGKTLPGVAALRVDRTAKDD